MTEQPSLLDSRELPPAFVDEWQRLEAERRITAKVTVDTVVRERFGTTIALKVDGKRVAVVNRSSPEVAARDLFTLAFGPIRENA